MSDLSKIEKMDRKELISFCESNQIPFRTKDGTEDIRKKTIKFLASATEVSKPVSKKPEVKKEVPIKEKSVSQKSDKNDEQTPIKEPIVEQDEKYNVKLNQIGQNMTVVIDGIQRSKVVPDAKQREAIKQLIASINKKRTKADTDKLMNIFKSKEESIGKAEELDIHKLAASVSALTVQMEQLTKIVTESMKASVSAPKTEAPPSDRTGEKPYR